MVSFILDLRLHRHNKGGEKKVFSVVFSSFPTISAVRRCEDVIRKMNARMLPPLRILWRKPNCTTNADYVLIYEIKKPLGSLYFVHVVYSIRNMCMFHSFRFLEEVLVGASAAVL